MNIVEPFIKRPVMTTLVMLAILLFGALGYRQLAVSDLPNVDYPTIQVQAVLPGATSTELWERAGVSLNHLPSEIIMSTADMVSRSSLESVRPGIGVSHTSASRPT